MSNWDKFVRIPGKTFQGTTGDKAVDHYHRYKEDVKLMAQMGLKTYRFSISWPRVIPDGNGAINEKGLKFYDDLINELIANNIVPMVTVYHWDMPGHSKSSIMAGRIVRSWMILFVMQRLCSSILEIVSSIGSS